MSTEHVLFEELPRSCPGIWVDNWDCSCDPGHGELTELQKQMLDIESRFYKYPGTKGQAIRDETGLKVDRYLQLLNALLDTRKAFEAEPVLVGRLRELRATPKWRRTA